MSQNLIMTPFINGSFKTVYEYDGYFRGGVKFGMNNCIVNVSAMQLNKKNIEIVYKVI